MKDHDEESAKRICGALEQKAAAASQQEQSSKATSYEDNNGRLFLKIFLLDGSVNMNDWGVAPSSIPRNIPTAIGKPVVLYKNAHGEYDHPSLTGQDSLDHALAYQDLYRIGTYIDVFESKTKPGQWWGIAEVTDEGVRKAIREDPSIPFYVSPTIRLLHPNQNDQSITEWAFMHSAVVDKPAYTTQKAYISGQCSGNSNTCLLQLRKASISANNGKVGCGFCTYEATKDIQNNIVKSFSSPIPNGQQLHNRHEIMANGNNETRNSSAENNNQQQQEQPSNQQNVTQQVEQQEKETTSKVTKQVGNNNNNNNADNKDDAEEERRKREGATDKQKQASAQELLETVQRQATVIEDLKLKLQTSNATNDSLKSLNSQYNERLAKVEEDLEKRTKAERLNSVTDIVQKSAIYQTLSNEDKQRQIETFDASGMSIEQIQKFIEPLNASFKKAAAGYMSASYTPKLRLGADNKSGTAVETRSASTSNNTSRQSDELPAHLRLHKVFGSSGGVQ